MELSDRPFRRYVDIAHCAAERHLDPHNARFRVWVDWYAGFEPRAMKERPIGNFNSCHHRRILPLIKGEFPLRTGRTGHVVHKSPW